MSGHTLGIVGLGRIGTAVALRAKAFNLRVIFYDPFIEHGKAKALGIRYIYIYIYEYLYRKGDINKRIEDRCMYYSVHYFY